MKLQHLESNNACIFTYGSEFNPVWEHPAALDTRYSQTGLTVWCQLPPSVSITPVFNTLWAAVRFLRRGLLGLIECPPATAYYVNSVSLMEWAEMAPDTRRAYLKRVTLSEVEAAKAKAVDEEMPELTFRELALADAAGVALDCFLTEGAAEKALEYWDFQGFGHSGKILAAVKRRLHFIPPADGEYFGSEWPYWRVLLIDRTKRRGYVWDATPDTIPSIKQILPPGWWDIWERHEYSAIKKALIDARAKKEQY